MLYFFFSFFQNRVDDFEIAQKHAQFWFAVQFPLNQNLKQFQTTLYILWQFYLVNIWVTR